MFIELVYQDIHSIFENMNPSYCRSPQQAKRSAKIHSVRPKYSRVPIGSLSAQVATRFPANTA